MHRLPTLLALLVIICLAVPLASAQQVRPKGQLGPATAEPAQRVLAPAGPSAAASPEGKAPVRPTPPGDRAYTTILDEGFEGAFPYSPWAISAAGTDATWDDATYRPATGSWSLYCADVGSAAPPPGGPYPNDMSSWAIYGPFDLSDATDAEVVFSLWAETESDYDFVYWLASANGTDFYGERTSGDTGGWTDVTFDLTDVFTLGDLTGEPEVWIAFLFTSDFIVSYEGAYVDDLVIRKQVGPTEPDIDVSPTELTLTEPAARPARSAPPRARPDGPLAEHVPGRLLVRFAPEVSVDAGAATTSSPAANALGADAGLHAVRPVFRPVPGHADRFAAAGLGQVFVLDFDAAGDLRDLVAAYEALPEVVYAEPDYLAHTTSADPPGAPRLTPNDPTFSSQWGLSNTGQAIPYSGGGTVGTPGADINAVAAWDVETGASDVVLAVLDTGVDPDHPEFAGRIAPGYDFIGNDNDPSPIDNAHGTAAAGIAAAAGNNGQGVAGVAWGVQIMPIRVLGENGSGSWSQVAGGVQWAADNGADVLSMSLGGGGGSTTLANAVAYAHGAGSVVFAASGNNNSDNASAPFYPASYPEVISVGALSPCDTRKTPSSCDGEFWWGSNYGGGLDFLAPGVRIHTTDITGSNGYASGDYTSTFNGTSSACPFAAGVGALLVSENPALTPDEVRAAMQSTAVDLGAAGYDDDSGYGRLDAAAALAAVSSAGLFQVANLGTGDLTVASITSDQPWLSATPDGPFTVEPDGIIGVLVGIDWAMLRTSIRAGGGTTGTLTVASDDPDEPAVAVTVTAVPAGGSGLPAGIVAWFAADDPALAPGARVALWPDATGNGHDAFSPSSNPFKHPLHTPGAFPTGADALAFDGARTLLLLPDDPDLGGGTIPARTMAVAFKTGSDVTTRQVLYEQGNWGRGINLYLDDGWFFVAAWNRIGREEDFVSWPLRWARQQVAPNTAYVGALVLDGEAGTFTAYLDGTEIGSLTGTGDLWDSTQPSIGAMVAGARFAGGQESGQTHYLDGEIGEIVMYNEGLAGADLDAVLDYLGGKYLGGAGADVAPAALRGEGLPAEFALDGAYPNPLRGRATVGFALPESAEVRLEVFDVLGRRVAVLAEGAYEAGRHAVTFEAAGLGGGVYMLRLRAGPFTTSQRVTLLD